jgi:hypothetical protein
MGSELELYDARLSYIHFSDGAAALHFSYAYIHKTVGAVGRDTGRGWSQEAVLLVLDAQVNEPLPPLPNVIVEGYLEAGGTRYELIPLPFEREGAGLLHLEFSDGTVLELRGEEPQITLQGAKVFLEDFT